VARGTPIELAIPPGLFPDETARSSKGRYKNCDKVRFQIGTMPEKLGGWILSSFGHFDGEQVEFDYIAKPTLVPSARVTYSSVNYGAAAASIALGSTIGATAEGVIHSGDQVWLFDDSLVGGMGGRTLTGAIGSYTATANANITATITDACLIRYPSEFAGLNGATVVDGLGAGAFILTLGSAVTLYLAAGTIVRVQCAGGDFFTKLETGLISGATMITLQDPVPTAVTGGVQLYPAGTHFIQEGVTSFGYVIRFLAQSVAASTALQFTRPLPAAVAGHQIDVRPFQKTFANGDHTSVSTINIAPSTAFAIASHAGGSNVGDGLVFFPQFEQQFTRYIGQARAVHDWKDLEDQQWAAIGTDKKLYVVNNGQLFDITPVRATAILTAPFATVVLTNVVTVTDVAHGAEAGDYVRFTGSTAVGGLSLDGEYPIVSIIDADNYTIAAASFATSTTSGGGTVNVEYDISAGLASSSSVVGWGTGSYGSGTYGVGQAGVGILLKLRIWSLDNFGEDLLASPSGGALYHWDRTGGPTTRAVVVPEAPATIQRMLVSPQARIVVLLGAGTGNFVTPGPPDSLFIRWSDSEAFNVYIPTSTNAAGDIRLDKGSEIITAVESRGDIVVNTDQSMHALQYIAGDLIFGLRHLGQSVAIIGPNAMVDVNGVVRFMSDQDFIIFDGVIRVLPSDVHDYVFNDFNTAQGYKVFCSVNKTFNEITWFYPSAASTEPDRYVTYNYVMNVWYFGTMNRTAFHDSSRFLLKPYGLYDGLMWQHETGTDETDSEGKLRPMTAYIESGDLEVDEAGASTMHIGAMIPDFKTLTGEIELRVKGRRDPQGAQNFVRGPFVVTSSTERVPGIHIKSRQLAFEVRSDKIGDNWRMGNWKAEPKKKGHRRG
jgi:hypothetical protein